MSDFNIGLVLGGVSVYLGQWMAELILKKLKVREKIEYLKKE